MRSPSAGAALPPRFPSTPLFQEAPALAPLAGPPALGDLLAIRRVLAEDHAALAAGLPPARCPSLAEWAWAHAICASRTFGLTIEGAAASALVPVADCFDHGAGDARWGYDDRAGGLAITAARDLPAGAPIHLAYGTKSNARLLCSYGFCLPDNPHAEAVIFHLDLDH